MADNTRTRLAPTPEATIGPFFPGTFVDQFASDLTRVAPLVVHQPQGTPISLALHFVDAAGKPVPSLIVESWQANARGRYRHPSDRSEAPLDPQFDGFARMRTGDDGICTLKTIKPGAYRVGVCVRAPHIRLTIFASGIDRLNAQVFFDDEPENASDPVLNSIGDAKRRDRLIAKRTRTDRGYELTIVMRGEEETPFFDDAETGSDG